MLGLSAQALIASALALRVVTTGSGMTKGSTARIMSTYFVCSLVIDVRVETNKLKRRTAKTDPCNTLVCTAWHTDVAKFRLQDAEQPADTLQDILCC